MKRPHLMAAVSFAVALAFYMLGLATDYLAGFFALGVFFEVVERRDYDGYGAVNAAIRLNAQARHRDPAGL